MEAARIPKYTSSSVDIALLAQKHKLSLSKNNTHQTAVTGYNRDTTHRAKHDRQSIETQHKPFE